MDKTMTPWDYFAGAALIAVISDAKVDIESKAQLAAFYADRMNDERLRRQRDAESFADALARVCPPRFVKE